jgi:type IV pilus assembly protein PilY1
MKAKLGFLLLPSLVMLVTIGLVFWAGSIGAAVTNADYSGTPPFISTIVTPNVLIMLDNSGSMGFRAVCNDTTNFATPYTACPTAPEIYGAGTSFVGAPFVETITFVGMFDSLSCYAYDSANRRFAVTTSKAALTTACATTDWDGNFLNWVTFRRQDALKKALIGAQCAVARLSDGLCPPSGSPALVTIKGEDGPIFFFGNISTAPVTTGACAPPFPPTGSCANGRVPTAIQALVSSSSLVIHMIGNASGSLVRGGFCVGNSSSSPPSSSCGIVLPPTTPANGQFLARVAVTTEPLGVIQDLGDKARFGLLEFRSSGDGGKVLVPIGSTVATPYDLSTVTRYSSNKIAIVAAIEQTAPATGTPLAETLYTGIRYIAQLPQPFSSTTYLYPCAFSGCGPAFPSSTSRAGAIGPVTSPSGPEPSLLASGDTCPAGLGYISGACGRDPYFFGTNPAWVTSPNPTQVPCCKTFIMFLTDGEANLDSNIPVSLRDHAHAAHGPHCAGSYSPTTPPPTAAQYLATTTCFNSNTASIDPAVLLLKHKVDYLNADLSRGSLAAPSINHSLDDVAYWGHVNDLRQATIPVTGESGHPLPGFQNVTIYPVFAFGNINGRELLMQAAKQGGFDDQNSNNLPDLQAEWDKVDNVTGLQVPDGIPDTYFESQNANDIRDKLLATLTSIFQNAASGTSVSVLATSATGEGAVYQAYFFPTTFVNLPGGVTSQVAWTGYAQGLFIDKLGNLREDYSAPGCTGPPDGLLVLTHDCIIKIRLDTATFSVRVDRFVDANGDGRADDQNGDAIISDGFTDTNNDGILNSPQSLCNASGTGTALCPLGSAATPKDAPSDAIASALLTSNGLSNIQPLWEGGRRLALMSPGATCESSTNWPQSSNLTESGSNCRRILTWADLDNGGDASTNEQVEFSTASAFTLCPYLGGKAVKYCNGDNSSNITAADTTADPDLTGCTGITRRACAQNEATTIIDWIRGNPVTGLRDRTFNVVNDAGVQVQAQWKLGDVVNSRPVVVGPPRERYDTIYGDTSYARFFQQYKDRRQVAYLGGNDGMLHAFNAGFFNADDSPIDGTGPTVQVRFTTVPKQKGTSTTCAALPCDASVTTYAFRADAPPLGAELWAFIPQDLLPQLRWMTSPNYSHVYYVDLTPKITDVRIFTADADHPGGWGTILIGGFRLGGSCTNCTAGKGTPRVVNADFNYDGDTTDGGNGGTSGSDSRVFLSSYFVLDITNPEKEPRLLWTFRDQNLGLTTTAPAVFRLNPSSDAKTSSTNEKWYVAFGTGPTHHDAFSSQTAQMFVVDLEKGPSYSDINKTNGLCSTALPCVQANTSGGSGQVRAYSTGVPGAFMADAVSLDFALDFRVDVVYAGSVICNGATTSSGCGGTGPLWKGAMWRLTTNGGDINPDTWGVSSGCSGTSRCPSRLISTFAYTAPQATTCTSASPCNVGPIATAPVLTEDDTRNIWLFFGTGRFFALVDKTNTDIQHFIGVKDCIINGGCSDQGTERNNLFNSSDVVVCSSCVSGTNVSTTGSTQSFTIGFSASGGSLVNSIQNMDGWFTTFNDPTRVLLTPPQPTMTLGERNVSTPTLIGGTVFFTTFTPTTDICTASGTGHLYAVFYLTGGPYTNAAIGTVPSGSQALLQKAISLGQGIPSQMAVQIGAQGSGGAGASSIAGCAGRVTGYIQASTGVLGSLCGTPALSVWSRMVSWRDM